MTVLLWNQIRLDHFFITEKCSLRCLSGDKADFRPDSPVGSLDQLLMEHIRAAYFFLVECFKEKTMSMLH